MSTDPSDEGGRPSCPHCARSFATAHLRTLHLGEAHPEGLGDEQWRAVDDARAAEAAELRRLRLKMAMLVVGLYFGFVVLYALV